MSTERTLPLAPALPRWLIAIISATVGLAVLAGLVLLSRANYLLFHALAELVGVCVAWSVFALAWSARRYRQADNGYLLVVGVMSLFVGLIDLVHTLAYRGMGVFPGHDANLATQLWIASRYVQSLSLVGAAALLFAPAGSLLQRPRDPYLVLLGYALVTALLLAACLAHFFPICYVEGVGLTPFKRISEYIISALLLSGLVALWRRRTRLKPDVLRWLLIALAANIGAELAFTFYAGVYDLANMVGHLLKTMAFAAIYRAVVITGIDRPLALLFRALQTSEEHYRHLAENTQDYIMRYDREHRHIYANKAALEVSGRTWDEYVGKTHREMGFPEDLCALWERAIDRVFETGQPGGQVFEWESAQGKIVLDWRLAPEIENGVVATVLAVSRDITAIKQAEQALREHQVELAAIYENAPVVMMLVDRDQRVRRANGFAQAFTGLRISEMVGQRWGEALRCLHAPRGDEEYGHALCADCPVRHLVLDTLETGFSHHQVEASLPFLAEGQQLDHRFLVSTTRLDVSAEPLALISLLDITKRVRAEQALQASEALLEETQTIARLGGWELDVATGDMVWTMGTYHIHEAPVELRPTLANALAFHPPDDRAMLEEAVRRAIDLGEPYDLELRFITLQGKNLWVRCIGNAEWREGRVAKLSGTIQDVTELKRATDALRRARDELDVRVQERTRDLTAANAELMAVTRAEHRQRELAEALVQAANALSRSLELDEVLGTFLEQLHRAIPYDCANIMLPRDPTHFDVRTARGYGRWADYHELLGQTVDVRDSPALQAVIAERQSVLIANTDEVAARQDALCIHQGQSWLGAPLVVGEQVIGICGLGKDEPGYFTAEHAHLVEALVAQAAVAVQNAWLFEQVRTGRERLQFLARRLVEVQESERRYIARELHDEAGQALTTLKLGLRLLERNAHRPEAVIAGVEELMRGVDSVLGNLHRMAMDLRPASLDYLGLEAALRQYVESLSDRYGVMAQFEAMPLPQRLPSEVETSLYRIVQEALTNVIRHAGATRVDVILGQDEESLTVLVEDNGAGFNPATEAHSGHLGLLGMRERTEMLGGSLVVESAVGVGTTVRVQVPYGNANPHRG